MATKSSKSILGSLKKMLHRDSEKTSGPVRKKSPGPAQKKSVAPAAEKRASSAETAAPQEITPEAKPDKRKTPNQPWYRHRQRW
jgi:hypothetical protein